MMIRLQITTAGKIIKFCHFLCVAAISAAAVKTISALCLYVHECDSAPDDVSQAAATCKSWPGASCCPAVLLLCLCSGAGACCLPCWLLKAG